jgi:tetratricopeptide (TPR) repeat protein
MDDEGLAEGLRAAREGRTADAIAALDAAITSDPTFAKAYLYRGHLRAELGDDEAALADFTQVTRLQPERSEGWNARGRVCFDRGDWTRALDEFTRAAGCEAPTDLDLIERNRAECLRALGALDEAEVALDRALALRSDDAETWCARARVRFDRADLDGALADALAAARLAPDRAEPWCSVAHVQLGRDEVEAALEAAARSIAIAPTAFAYELAARAEFRRERFAAALMHVEAWLALDPERGDTHAYHGLLLEETGGSLDEAHAAYQRALLLLPPESRLHGDVEVRWHRLEAGRQAATEASRAAPAAPTMARLGELDDPPSRVLVVSASLDDSAALNGLIERGAQVIDIAVRVEFFSEVFVDGQPLTRVRFDADARAVGPARILAVHAPRIGAGALVVSPRLRMFVSRSEGIDVSEQLVARLIEILDR